MTKLLVLMLVITVVPLLLLGAVALRDAKGIGMAAAQDARAMGDKAVAESTGAMNDLGVATITQKAVDVAKQLEIYIKDHPQMTVAQLQKDPYFSQLAVQSVGKTGYTAVTDIQTLWCRWHSNPKIADSDLHNLASKLPGFWGVMVKSEGGKPSSGYYDWAEPDGSIKQKYMYISIVDAKTADNVQFSVAATTYIDEFSAPAVMIGDKINTAVDGTVTDIKTATEGLSTQNTILSITIIMAVLVVILGFFTARSIIQPIKKMNEVANKVSLGNLNQKLDIRSKDEIGDLGNSFQRMVNAFKVMDNMNQQAMEKEVKS